MQRKFTLLLTALVMFSLMIAPVGRANAQEPEGFKKAPPVNRTEYQPASSLNENPAGSADIMALNGPNFVGDPSIELSYYLMPPYWWQSSTNFGTPLCIIADCTNGGGTAGPRSGSVWSWFGGVNFAEPGVVSPEIGDIYQNVIFPSCSATLQFYFWIGAAESGSDANDYFQARVDGITVFSANATQISSYPTYTLVSVDVSSFADSGAHIVEFYSNISGQLVTFNLDDIALFGGNCSISGNAGVAGATLSYTGGSTSANGSGNYSINVPHGWSGTVTPSKAGYIFSPANMTYSNVVSNYISQNYTAIPLYSISGNVGVAGATLGYTDGIPQTVISQSNGNYSLTVPDNWTGTVTPTHACFTFGPGSRNYGGITGNQTAQNYAPTFSPASGCADIDVLIGGTNQGRFGIPAQGSTRASFTGLNNGPVKITSTNATSLITAERVIYKINGTNTSFSEMMALPNSQLDSTYWLPWYNNVDLDTQLRFGNVSGSTATVHVSIGGVEMAGSPFTLGVGGSTRVSFAGVNNGPVQIVSDVDIVAAERLIYKVNGVNTSFSEMMALPASQLETTYWLPWYNNVDLDTQLRFGNVSNSPATVHVYIGGAEMPGSPFTLAIGASTRKSFAGMNNGPVQIVSNVNIVAAERVIYKVNGINTSFSEMMGLPNSQLDNTYWLPWYNNVDLDTQLRFGVP